MIRCRSILSGMVLAAVGVVVPTAVQGAEIFSVEEFQAVKSRWNNFVAISVPITIEGRIASRSPKILRLRGCAVRFVAAKGKTLPEIARKTTNVEITGVLVRKGKRFSIVVQRMKTRPSDADTFATMRFQLPLNRSAPWYRAGKWARQRGRFYQDRQLLSTARKAFRTAVRIERTELPKGNSAAVFQLAKKATTLGLADEVSQNLTHWGYRMRWLQLSSKDGAATARFGTELKKKLSGASDPLKKIPQSLAARYRKDPQRIYESSNAKTRKTLHRLLFIEVALRRIRWKLDSNDSNGFAVAAEIDKTIPEMKSLGEKLRERELSYRLKNVGTARRDQVVKLAARFRKRNALKKATLALSRWLKAREPRLRKEGVTGLLRLAEETQQLLNDKKRTVALLMEAAVLAPNSTEIVKRFQRLGYEKRNGKWQLVADARDVPPNRLTQAMRNGNVVSGMSPLQVRRTMAGSPKSIHRMATSGTINAVWVFERTDGSRVVVHFRRSRNEPRSKARVQAVNRIPVR